MPYLHNAYLRIAILIAITLVPFTAARIGLLVAYENEFAELSLWQTVMAMVHGLRFDLSIILVLLTFPLLLLLLPFRWAHQAWWQKSWLWLIFLFLMTFIFVIAGDSAYFGFVNRHAGPEVTAMLSDFPLLWDMAISDYPHWLILFAVGFALTAYGWKRWMMVIPAQPAQSWQRWLVIVALFLVFALCIRGGTQYKPIGIASAFSSGSLASGYLTLNGPFAVAHSIISTKATKKKFMPERDAVSITRAALFDGAAPVYPEYPLMEKSSNNSSNRPNIVVLMFESWDSAHTDRQRELKGLPPLGVTPNFDRLSKEGQLYTNFYATGQRSMDGLAAILAGMPTLPDMPYIGQGLEQSRMSYLGDLARAEGYQTLFMQSSNRGSFNIDSIASIAGFTNYLGAEDIPEDPSISAASDWGTWDHLMLEEASRQIQGLQGPFISFLFTSTTHNPWRVPEEKWKKYPGETDLERYLNTLYYADAALGDFMERAKQSSYFDNTIFVITADHIGRFDVTADPRSRFHIPLLIIGPGIEPSIEEKVAGQMDILPTIADLANWQQPYSALGRSLITAPEDRGLFAVNWKTLIWMEKDSWLMHNLNQRMGSMKGKREEMDQEKDLLAHYQVAVTLLTENRIYKKPKRENEAAH